MCKHHLLLLADLGLKPQFAMGEIKKKKKTIVEKEYKYSPILF